MIGFKILHNKKIFWQPNESLARSRVLAISLQYYLLAMAMHSMLLVCDINDGILTEIMKEGVRFDMSRAV